MTRDIVVQLITAQAKLMLEVIERSYEEQWDEIPTETQEWWIWQQPAFQKMKEVEFSSDPKVAAAQLEELNEMCKNILADKTGDSHLN